MACLSLSGTRLDRRMRTTRCDQAGRRFDDLIGRDLRTGEPNQRYVGDITYLPVQDGSSLQFVSVIDLGSRKLTGWVVGEHMRTELVEEAFKAACAQRGGLAGAVFHCDHGSVCTSKAYTALCEQLGLTQSMGAIGSSAHGALAESFNAALKRELLADHKAFPDTETAYRSVFHWANRYNTRRHHSAISNVPPNTYENTTATLTTAPRNAPRAHTTGVRSHRAFPSPEAQEPPGHPNLSSLHQSQSSVCQYFQQKGLHRRFNRPACWTLLGYQRAA